VKVSILQPGYLPWLGYFEQMVRADVFVHYDDVQYTKNDWRNRNRVKTKAGTQWLTVPVTYHYGQKISEVIINNHEPWRRRHIGALRTNYRSSPFFDAYFHELVDILNMNYDCLVDLDLCLIEWLTDKLGISVRTFRASRFGLVSDDRQLRIIEVCKSLGCTTFYEGRAGANYIDVGLFRAHGIEVEFQEYGHPFYHQQWMQEQGFVSHLSVIDLLFNHGPDSLAISLGEKVIEVPVGTQLRHASDV